MYIYFPLVIYVPVYTYIYIPVYTYIYIYIHTLSAYSFKHIYYAGDERQLGGCHRSWNRFGEGHHSSKG